MYFLYRYYLLLEKGVALLLNKLESSSPKDALCQVGWHWLSGSEEEDFLISSMYFHCSIIICPWKRAGPFFWTIVNPLHPKLLCAQFGWNWPIGSGEEDFLILSMYFRYLVIISPWEKAGPFFWTNLIPLHPRMLCAKFGWNWPSGSGEEDENVKSLQTDGQTDRQTDGQTDDGRQVIRKAHLSFQLRWAKKLLIQHFVKPGSSYNPNLCTPTGSGNTSCLMIVQVCLRRTVIYV